VDKPTEPSERSAIWDVIKVITLKDKNRKLDRTVGVRLSRIERLYLESTLQTAAQRLVKYDVAAEMLSSLSDDDDDDDDDDDLGNATDDKPLAADCSDDCLTTFLFLTNVTEEVA